MDTSTTNEAFALETWEWKVCRNAMHRVLPHVRLPELDLVGHSKFQVSFMAINVLIFVQLYYETYKGYNPILTMVRMIPMIPAGIICNIFIGLLVGKIYGVVLICKCITTHFPFQPSKSLQLSDVSVLGLPASSTPSLTPTRFTGPSVSLQLSLPSLERTSSSLQEAFISQKLLFRTSKVWPVVYSRPWHR